MNCFTPWRAARSTSRMPASTFTSHDEYGLSSTDGSLAMLARWKIVSNGERSTSSIVRTSSCEHGQPRMWRQVVAEPHRVEHGDLVRRPVEHAPAVSFVPT